MSATETESKSWVSHTQQPHHTSPFAWQSYFAYATKTHAKTYTCMGNWFFCEKHCQRNSDINTLNNEELYTIWITELVKVFTTITIITTVSWNRFFFVVRSLKFSLYHLLLSIWPRLTSKFLNLIFTFQVSLSFALLCATGTRNPFR